MPATGHLAHPQAPARTKTTRNLHAAIARRHWFNAHYVHDRALLLRRFGARPPIRRWDGARIERAGGRQVRQTWQQALIRAVQAVHAALRVRSLNGMKLAFLAGCHPLSRSPVCPYASR
jgi:hypothetical protein